MNPPRAPLEVPRPGHVDVWIVDMTQTEGREGDLAWARAWLSREERERAARFHFERDRRRFVVTHAARRAILGAYLGCAPAAVPFETGPHGKPALRGHRRDLQFNATDTDGLGLLAVTTGRRVGIDAERVRPFDDLYGVARLVLTQHEQQTVFAAPPNVRPTVFLHFWTWKEAVLKVLGTGLTLPATCVDVRLDSGLRPQLAALDVPGEAPETWTLCPLTVGDGYVAGLAIDGPLGATTVRRWPLPTR
ncbi:MAG: 4'-phosphopantetheinyl transferase superfamily protein [Chloroflexi bacterium]|nr:4'-phosphopantetheinyl transferase superfamily protein [Chloroflexota bacterium]